MKINEKNTILKRSVPIIFDLGLYTKSVCQQFFKDLGVFILKCSNSPEIDEFLEILLEEIYIKFYIKLPFQFYLLDNHIYIKGVENNILQNAFYKVCEKQLPIEDFKNDTKRAQE